MPPPGMPRPDPATVNSFVTFLETSLDNAALASPNPGTVALHRLNRAEYQNAMKDILGVNVDAAALLPRDDISNGFDNIANVLKVSPSFLDQYIAAARAVSRQAISYPPPSEPVRAVLHGEPADPEGLPLGTQGGIAVKHLFPFDGDYIFSIAGPDPILTIDGLPVSLSGGGFVHVTKGVHELGLTSRAHSFAEPDGMLQSFIPGRAFPGYGFPPGGAGPGGRRGPSGPSIEITGPYHATGKPAETESRAKIFVCQPPSESEEASCASRILSEVAHRAFRRPVLTLYQITPSDHAECVPAPCPRCLAPRGPRTGVGPPYWTTRSRPCPSPPIRSCPASPRWSSTTRRSTRSTWRAGTASPTLLRAPARIPDVRVVDRSGPRGGGSAPGSTSKRSRRRGIEALLGANRGCFAAFAAVYECEVPVIAAVHGFCLGGGIGLVGNADIMVASDDATFGLPEVDRGALGAATHLVPAGPAAPDAGDGLYRRAGHRRRSSTHFGSVLRVVPREELPARPRGGRARSRPRARPSSARPSSRSTASTPWTSSAATASSRGSRSS